jgi:2,4-dienoyl-CoA reductase-like NADH-dependent reductase (Old Yellow Enzyme family)/thioredoxin reductase
MPTVYDPIKVGTMWLKNRFVVAPTVKNHALESGFLNQRVLDNYEAEADGPGFVICGMSFTEPAGQVFVRQMGAHHDKCMGGLQNLAQVVHRQGAKCALQISHGGTLCAAGIIDQPVRGVSEKPFLPGQRPVPLTVGELEGVIENYAKASARIKAAGFDAVELHACHGSLLLQFMSPFFNVGRWDKYADRTVLFAETVQAMRDAVGPDFPFGVRLSTHEFGMEDLGYPGQTIEETCNLFIPIAEKIGVDWIHASVGRIGVTPDHGFPPVYMPHGVNVKFAEACKKAAHVPVMAVGRLMDPKLIEKIIEDGQADMVALSRPIIADQRFVKKMIEGRYDDIRKCIGCNYCLECLFNQWDCECTMNPLYGREKVWAVTPAPKKKKVMVVGGGVSGLQAALTASQRGHEVTLYEKSDKLGGQTNLAAAFPRLYTRDLMNVPDWLASEIKRSPVRVVMKTEVTPQLVEKEKPDAIVVATGAKETAPELPAGAKNVVYLWDYLRGGAKIGNKVVVLGGNDGAEAALSLARQGKEVTLVEKSANIALPSYIFFFSARREPLFRWMKEDKVTILTEHKVKAATGDTLTLADKFGVEKKVPYDTIVVAVGREPVNELYQAIATRGREVYLIGDAKEPRNMKDANQEAFWVGRHI